MAQDNVAKLEKQPAKPAMPKTFDEAMLAYQMESVTAVKDSKNPHFKNNYASLEAVIQAASQANKYGLYFMQPLDLIQIGETVTQVVKTIIVHTPSGEKRESLCPVRLEDKNNPQKMGSGITYAKRYALQSAFGLPSEDDDGNIAAQPKPNQPTTKPSEY
jgi:hypothetical protein